MESYTQQQLDKDIVVSCSFCPEGTVKTDKVKLVTIRGRDYFMCLDCIDRSGSYEKTDSRRYVSGV